VSLPLWQNNPLTLSRETDLDEVLQINNVFLNVSKGQACNADELQKAFGKSDISEIVKEVRRSGLPPAFLTMRPCLDTKERGAASRRKGARTRVFATLERDCNTGGGEMC
jgi:hypothetical protein